MENNNLNKLAISWAQINVKAWQDKKFKERLLKNPKETLNELGVEIPPHFKDVKISDALKGDVLHLELLPPPALNHISEEQLEKIAGGVACSSDSGMWCG